MLLNTRSIAIVGGGPRSLALLQQLVLRAKWHSNTKIWVTVFDPCRDLGCGRVYTVDQSPHLRMNIQMQEFSVFSEEFRSSYPLQAKTFQQWCNLNNESYSQAVPSRSLVGRYLHYAASQVLSLAGRNLNIEHVRSEVTDVRKVEDGYTLETSVAHFKFDYLAVVTGHQGWSKSGKQTDGSLMVYPVLENLSKKSIPAGSLVRVSGMSLTAFDAIIELTEGRGGTFTTNKDGTLFYSSKGEEPEKIVLQSRSGKLILPKAVFKASQKKRVNEHINSGVARLKAYIDDCERRYLSAEFSLIEELFFATASNVASTLHGAFVDTELWLHSVWQFESFDFTHRVGRALCSTDYTLLGAAAAAGLGSTLQSMQPIINKVSDFGGFVHQQRLDYKIFNKILEPIAFGAIALTAEKIYCLIDKKLVVHASDERELTDQKMTLMDESQPMPVARVKAFLPSPGYPHSGEVLRSLINQGVASVDSATKAVRTNSIGCALSANDKAQVSLGIFGRVTEHWFTGADSLKACNSNCIHSWVIAVMTDIGEYAYENPNAETAAESQLVQAL